MRSFSRIVSSCQKQNQQRIISCLKAPGSVSVFTQTRLRSRADETVNNSQHKTHRDFTVPSDTSYLPAVKSKGLCLLASLPVVSASVAEAADWTQSFGHAPSPYAEMLGLAPLGMFFFLQMSPMATVQGIKRDKTVGNMSPLPYITLGTNCVLWTAYGLLQSDPTLIAANGMGVILSSYYTSVYAKHTNSDMSQYYIGGAGFLAAAGIGYVAVPTLGITTGIDFLGIMGNLIAVAFFASPLAVIKTVLRDKSTTAMPFVVTVATTLNCVAWASYGLLVAHDPYVILPNIFGFGLAMVQLSLFARFGIAKSSTVKPGKMSPKV